MGERAGGKTPVAIILPAQKRRLRYWTLTLGHGWDLQQYQVKISPTLLNWTLPPQDREEDLAPSPVLLRS